MMEYHARSIDMTSMLSHEELEDFWALEVPLEAEYVPPDELARAVRESRVQYAFSTSSMGTAETYWSVVASDADPRATKNRVVLPPGQKAVETPFEEWADDGMVRALWELFWLRQIGIVCSKITPDLVDTFLAELAAVRARLAPSSKPLRARDPRRAWRIVLNAAKTKDLPAVRVELLRIGVRTASQSVAEYPAVT